MAHPSWKRVLRRRFRERLLAIHGEICELADSECAGPIHAHHRDGNVQNGNVSNGQILCQRHHVAAHNGGLR